ncbi:phage major capsid protein [Mycobacterium interjectum]|uniref:phage major capsid protein n=1 Tax=Mycobacterium interjectum TaxID=33895 RepID=UPI0008344410|nr:phage major capsid protein [Mycobacterium interjectum]MCV7092109.1 phage major capsid protein [Mycobacterium interjectum]
MPARAGTEQFSRAVEEPIDAGFREDTISCGDEAAGLHLSSSKLFDDADQDIASEIGKALANQIAETYDAAFTANTTVEGYSGLLSKASTTVDAGAATLSNLDKFVSARFAAEAHGAKLTHWLLDPTVAEDLSNLKKLASGSNEALLQFVEDGITIAGLPVLTSTHVDSATPAWGIDKTQQRFVVRNGTKVERFPSVTNDGQWVRGIMRAGWDTLNPAGIVRIWDATP